MARDSLRIAVFSACVVSREVRTSRVNAHCTKHPSSYGRTARRSRSSHRHTPVAVPKAIVATASNRFSKGGLAVRKRDRRAVRMSALSSHHANRPPPKVQTARRPLSLPSPLTPTTDTVARHDSRSSSNAATVVQSERLHQARGAPKGPPAPRVARHSRRVHPISLGGPPKPRMQYCAPVLPSKTVDEAGACPVDAGARLKPDSVAIMHHKCPFGAGQV